MSAGANRRRGAGRLAGPAALSAAVATAVVLFAPAAARACATCFGAADSAMTAGMNHAILTLLGVVGVVQAGFIALFWSIWRRSRRLRERRESFHLIDGGVG